MQQRAIDDNSQPYILKAPTFNISICDLAFHAFTFTDQEC